MTTTAIRMKTRMRFLFIPGSCCGLWYSLKLHRSDAGPRLYYLEIVGVPSKLCLCGVVPWDRHTTGSYPSPPNGLQRRNRQAACALPRNTPLRSTASIA